MEEVKKVPDEETGGGRQNTMKILDKREEVWEEKKKSDGWNGYHVLFTETTQFLIIWEDMKKKLKIAYFATLAFLILFVVCLGGAGIWNFIESALLSAVVPIIYGLFCRDDIYLKVFDPARDQGALYLPEEMMFVKFLPDGTISQEILEKGHHYVEVALNEVPLFIRKGKVIPVADVAQTVKDIDPATLRMIGYEGAEYDRYDDDGVSAL